MGLGCVQIESVVQVDPDAQACFVDLEELAQPGTEEGDHEWIAVGKGDGTVLFRTLAGIERGAGGEEGLRAERPEAEMPFALRASISAVLRRCNELGSRRRARWRGRGSNATSRTQTETDDLATPSFSAMSVSGQPSARSSQAAAALLAFRGIPWASSLRTYVRVVKGESEWAPRASSY